MDEFRGLITFNMVDPDVIIGLFVENFDLNHYFGLGGERMSSSEESSSLKTTNFLANMSTFIFIFLIVVVGVILALFLVMFCTKAISSLILSSLKKFRSDTFFGNSIKA